MKHNFKTECKNESGAIMLEIIAVLALMGVMGAMLFRQINHRNQELHNIQMASEIRIVKEAFSAWIQSNLGVLRHNCEAPTNKGDTKRCDYSSDTLQSEIASGNFFPEGYTNIRNFYTYSLYVYWRGNNWDSVPTYYGVVLPKETVLPDEGKLSTSWNFKRAARIAMLIGGDGGVYGPGLTVDGDEALMVGTAGSWELDIGSDSNTDSKIPWSGFGNLPVYGATTGFDVYQPEVEVEDAKVNLPNPWSLVVKDLGAYGAFAAGVPENGGCYTIRHDNAPAGGTVGSDTLSIDITNVDAEGCQPVLYVSAGDNGKVYIKNGVEVGYDQETGASSVSIEGGKDVAGKVVVADAQGRARIVLDGSSSAAGSSANTLTIKDGAILTNKTTGGVGYGSNDDYQYKLDPVNTSFVHDIRLGAMGGMRLSELLPVDILKSVEVVTSPTNSMVVNKPQCPSGYTTGLLIIPYFSGNFLVESDATRRNVPSAETDSEGYFLVPFKDPGGNYQMATAHATFPTIQIKEEPIPGLPSSAAEGLWSRNGSWEVTLQNNYGVIKQLVLQKYCVRSGLGGINITQGNDAQNLGSDINVTTSSTLTENDCADMGFGFNSTTHKCVSWTVADINNAASVDKARACQRAGYFWDRVSNTCYENKAARSGNQQGD